MTHKSCYATELLEQRVLLSLSPAGGELHVNAFTTGAQSAPATAMDGDGDFVVAWIDSFQEGGGGNGIFARRYNASGAAQGSEIHVNSFTPATQSSPTVGMDADGDFVVAWSSTDVLNGGIRAQRFDAAGNPKGGEMPIAPSGGTPAVAMDVAGDFVVAYSAFAGASGNEIFAQRYNSDGLQQGSPIHVNTYTSSAQLNPAIAMDASGDFVVVWESYLEDGNLYGLYGQRFNAAGQPQGVEFLVTTATSGNQRAPAVAMDLRGDFVATWNAYPQDGSDYGVYAQRFNASGVKQGGEFRVNDYTTGGQNSPAVAMDTTGEFLVAWASYGQGGVYARQYNASGVAVGATEFKVNTFTTSGEGTPAVAADHRGDYVVTWASALQEGAGFSSGVYAQRLAESTDNAGPLVAGVFYNAHTSQRILSYASYPPPLSQLVVSFSENVTDAGGSTGPGSVTNPANWLITQDGVDRTSAISSITYGFNFATGHYEATINLGNSYLSGNFLLKASDSIRDVSNNRLDGNFDGTPGGNLWLPFSIGSFDARGPEFRVNTYTTSGQVTPSVAYDGAGNFVVVWYDASPRSGIYGQRYDALGTAIGGEFRVNPTLTGTAAEPEVAMNDAGQFVVAWTNFSAAGSDIYAQIFNAAAQPVGSEFPVNTYTLNVQEAPSVGIDAAGNFVVAWYSAVEDTSGDGVYGQRFSASGAKRGAEFQVNSYTIGNQNYPAVAMDARGGFVIAWNGEGTGDSGGVFVKRYNSAGVAQGGDVLVNNYTIGAQVLPSVDMDGAGNFVVAWYGLGTGDIHDQVHARRFDASGNALGAEFPVNTITSGRHFATQVAVDEDGDFVITWQSDSSGGNSLDTYYRRFAADASAADAVDQLANISLVGSQDQPDVAIDPQGDFVVVWRDGSKDGDGFGIYAHRYDVNKTPTVGTLADAPDPVNAGNSFTLSASNVTDDSGFIGSVSFYRETNGEPGLQVGASGDTFVGTANSNVGGFWSVNVSTASLSAGTYTYWAQASDDFGLSGLPASTTNTVVGSGPAPSVTGSAFLFQTAPLRLTFSFDQNVGGSLTLTDLIVTDLTHSTTITPAGLSYNNSTNTATVTFNGLLPDANYRATLTAAGITNQSGTPMASNYNLDFFFLSGDANHDRVVDVSDLGILATNWQASGTFSQADFNLDGHIDVSDLGILATNWQKNVPAPSLPIFASVAAKTPSRRQTSEPSLADDVLGIA